MVGLLQFEQYFRKIFKDLKVDIFVNKIPFENPLNNENYLKMSNFLPEIANNILPGEKIDSIINDENKEYTLNVEFFDTKTVKEIYNRCTNIKK